MRRFFRRFKIRATFASILVRDLCPARSSFCYPKTKNMNLLDTISLTNGMPAGAGELILFFGVIALMIFDEIISKQK